MKKFRNYVLASVGFAALALTVSLTATGRATAEKVAEAVRVLCEGRRHGGSRVQYVRL